jgi:hypothetical protein
LALEGWWQSPAVFAPVEKTIFPEARRGRKSQRFSQAFGGCGGTADWLDATTACEYPIHVQSSARFRQNLLCDRGD